MDHAAAEMLSSGNIASALQPCKCGDCAIRYGVDPAVGCSPMMVVPSPCTFPEGGVVPLFTALLKLHTTRSPLVISPEVAGAIARP